MLPSRTQLENSVISHAPKDAIGPLFVDIVRGPILPPRGTKERDWQLRIWDQADFNGMWQGARSGLVKKIAHIPFEINGPPEKVQYFQDLLGYAHFSQGYEYLIEMWGRDYLTQSYGGIFEIAGPGDPASPLIEPPTGINHLDAGRCYVTGNPTYPILYYSLWDGKLHKMHASRIYQIVDDPIPDERYFGLGTSALERAISINQREVRMNQYVDTRLDDMPQPGLLALSGASRAQWDAWVTQYQRDTGNDRLGPFGRTIVVTSVDPNAGVTAESIPFAQTPEKFDMVAYKSLDVDEICLAIGIDRQEIWELAGRGLGSSNQSQVMAEKAKGKTTGTMISAIERFMNWAILPDDCEFEIKAKDNAEQTNNAAINLQYAQTAQALTAAGFTKQEVAKVMIEGSQTYKDAFTDDAGKLTVTSADPGIDVTTPSVTPAPAQPAGQGVTGTGNTPLANEGAKPGVNSQPQAPQQQKGLETPEHQRWFFANNPQFANGAGNLPKEPMSEVESLIRDHKANVDEVNKVAARGNALIAAHMQQAPISDMSTLKKGEYVLKHGEDESGHANIAHYQVHSSTNKHVRLQQLGYDPASETLTKYSSPKEADPGTYRRINESDLKEFKRLGHQHQKLSASIRNIEHNLRGARIRANDPSAIALARRLANTKAFSITRLDFENHFASILSRAVKGGARPNQIENLMLGLLQSSGVKAFSDGLREGGVNDAPDDGDLREIQNIIANSIDYLDPLLQAAFDGSITVGDVKSRAEMWANKTLSQFFNSGRISADKNAMYQWILGITDQHCPDCLRLNRQVHRFKDWYSRDWLPQSDRLSCHGFKCACKLIKTSEAAWGRF